MIQRTTSRTKSVPRGGSFQDSNDPLSCTIADGKISMDQYFHLQNPDYNQATLQTHEEYGSNQYSQKEHSRNQSQSDIKNRIIFTKRTNSTLPIRKGDKSMI